MSRSPLEAVVSDGELWPAPSSTQCCATLTSALGSTPLGPVVYVASMARQKSGSAASPLPLPLCGHESFCSLTHIM